MVSWHNCRKVLKFGQKVVKYHSVSFSQYITFCHFDSGTGIPCGTLLAELGARCSWLSGDSYQQQQIPSQHSAFSRTGSGWTMEAQEHASVVKNKILTLTYLLFTYQVYEALFLVRGCIEKTCLTWGIFSTSNASPRPPYTHRVLT